MTGTGKLMWRVWIWRLLLGFACVPLTFGQVHISAGDITGTVLDETGAAIPGVTIVVFDSDRGIRRRTQGDGAGRFHVPTLPPGLYTVQFETSSFSTRRLENVEVRVGDTVILRPELTVAPAEFVLLVEGEMGNAVETERTQQADLIDSVRIRNLPINRRDYLGLALLSPGVVESNNLVDDTDYRVPQTPQSGLSIGGNNGRGNAFTIDGVTNYYNSGGVRPSVSQEAVREFQINRNSFSAELGGAVGGAINIVTRSGSNDVQGNFFGFLRHRDIQARNFFDPDKSAFTRGQYGATVGGPLVHDQTHFFLAFERLDRHESAFVPILQDRSIFGRLPSSQQQLVDFFDASGSPQLGALAAAMRQALTTTNFPGTLALFDQNSGTFPLSEDRTQFLIRLDHRFSEGHTLFVRGNLTDGFNENAQFGALVGFNRSRNLDLFDGTWMLSDTHLLGQSWVSETRAAFGYNRFGVFPIDSFGPAIEITGFGSFGRDLLLPSEVIERQWQLQQNFTHFSGKHVVKFGADLNPVRDTARNEVFFGGRFSFGEAVPLAAILNSAAGDPDFASGLMSTLSNIGQPRLAMNVLQPISALQAFNLGLPTFYQQGFGDPNWRGKFHRYSFFVQESFRAHPRLTLNLGARYELELKNKGFPLDRNNLGPRFGFSWAATDDRKTVVRGGYGLFYSQINGQIVSVSDVLGSNQIQQVFVPLSGLPGFANPLTGRPLSSADILPDLDGPRSYRPPRHYP